MKKIEFLKKKLEVHLETKNKVTPYSLRRAHKINEGISFSFKEKGIQMFHDIFDYLDVEHSIRYKREPTKTFCNIYAYDFCSFTWAYLPRVFWDQMSFSKILEGEDISVGYGKTVRELSANKLYDFFVNEGKEYHNWEKVESSVELQELANAGHVCIISGKHKNGNKSGHITVVAPESEKFTRQGLIPVQSQAGASNFKYKARQDWYLNKRYSNYGFFVNRRPSNFL